MKRLTPGSYSHGTRRLQDLIPKFVELIRECRGAAPLELLPPRPALKDENHPWWRSADVHALMTGLLDYIDYNLAPEGYYFGTHPDDGSDFGVWEIKEWAYVP